MYLHSYVSIHINTAAKHLKLYCRGKQVYTNKQGHIWRIQKHLFIAHFSVGIHLVVNWPNHSPGIDVEQGASRARGSIQVAQAQPIAHILEAMHAQGNGAFISSCN
jgi:hypothetical protein